MPCRTAGVLQAKVEPHHYVGYVPKTLGRTFNRDSTPTGGAWGGRGSGSQHVRRMCATIVAKGAAVACVQWVAWQQHTGCAGWVDPWALEYMLRSRTVMVTCA